MKLGLWKVCECVCMCVAECVHVCVSRCKCESAVMSLSGVKSRPDGLSVSSRTFTSHTCTCNKHTVRHALSASPAFTDPTVAWQPMLDSLGQSLYWSSISHFESASLCTLIIDKFGANENMTIMMHSSVSRFGTTEIFVWMLNFSLFFFFLIAHLTVSQ